MEQPHVVIFPYDEHGHVTPAFSFGRALACRGVRVTGVLTATRFAGVTSTPDDSSLFRIEAIPDCGGDAGKQNDVVYQHSLQKLEPGFEDLMLGMRPRPSCLVSDLLYPWSQDLADRLSLPRFQFCVFPAVSLLILQHVPMLSSKGLLPFQPGMEEEVINCVPGLPKEFRVADVPVDFLGRDREQLEVLSAIQKLMKRAAGTVVNTIYELEPHVVDEFSAEGLSLYTIGPMSNMDWAGHRNQMPSLIAEDEGCLRWLDNQPRSSVVYVALGSIVSLTEEETQEVALGLEACGQPFLWVLRRKPGDFDPMSALPAGFLERTTGRGCVIAWAPQTAVLAHSSVGCFLTHCGMGSVLEAIWAGVPMIGGFCKVSDQNTIRWLVTKEWGVGMTLQDRNVSPVPPLRHTIEKCVKEMIHGKKGLALSQNALQLKAAIRKAVEPNGSSYLNLTKLADATSSTPNSSNS